VSCFIQHILVVQLCHATFKFYCLSVSANATYNLADRVCILEAISFLNVGVFNDKVEPHRNS